MSSREQYAPGAASGAEIRKDGEKWTLVLVRDLPHPPAKVWKALTDPEHLREWAPFDSDRNLGAVGCLDVLERLLTGQPIGRIVGPEAMKFGGWQRLNAEYAKQFGIRGAELVTQTRAGQSVTPQ